jgi:hypothetical protein
MTRQHDRHHLVAHLAKRHGPTILVTCRQQQGHEITTVTALPSLAQDPVHQLTQAAGRPPEA